LKILFLSNGSDVDYQSDMLFHGLREEFGPDVVDVNPCWYMYNDITPERKVTLYGKGFSLAGLLPPVDVDRTDITAKIEKQYFDLVVYGSVWRNTQFYQYVAKHYPPQRVAYVDGEDHPGMIKEVTRHGVYFKREFYGESHGALVFPIQFAIPEEKCLGASNKQRYVATIDPIDTSTYIYTDEKQYYDDYRMSLFGITMKKAGWDCLRHYEILACECIPYFRNLEHCPPTIMSLLPKEELLLIKNMIEYNGFSIFQQSYGRDLWAAFNEKIQAQFKAHLTTKALAKRFVEQMKSVK
jgi:hypothetical protein